MPPPQVVWLADAHSSLELLLEENGVDARERDLFRQCHCAAAAAGPGARAEALAVACFMHALLEHGARHAAVAACVAARAAAFVRLRAICEAARSSGLVGPGDGQLAAAALRSVARHSVGVVEGVARWRSTLTMAWPWVPRRAPGGSAEEGRRSEAGVSAMEAVREVHVCDAAARAS